MDMTRRQAAAMAVLGLGAALAPRAAWAEAAPMGDDGLHKPAYFQTTFKDLREDMAAAKAEGKRFAIIFEQAGCIYCRKLHQEVLSDAAISGYLADHFYVVQYNLYGDEAVTDLDGEALTEKTAARRWGVLFTPTFLFFDDVEPAADARATDLVVATMPGAFGKGTTRDMFSWIVERGYAGDEDFQRYHARRIAERNNGSAE